MGALSRVALIFYVSLIWITSVSIILFCVHALDLMVVVKYVTLIYRDSQIATVVVIAAGAFMIMSYILARMIDSRRLQQRTVAFDNPGGPVAVSLIAIEDLIKRLHVYLPAIKEIRPFMIVKKKGREMDVDIKLVLRSEVNLPDLTTRLQDMVRRKIEEAIGIDAKINIRILVAKILFEEKKGGKLQPEEDRPVPFHGYRP